MATHLQRKGAASTEISGLTLAEALRTPTFYLVAGAFFSVAMMVTVLHFYQVAILESHGLDTNIAAMAFPVSALVMILTMPAVGRLFDRFKTRRVIGAALLIIAASLVQASLATGLWSTMLYAVLFGLANAFSLTMFGYLWPRYFGRKHVGSIQGTGQMVAVVGTSLGPLPVGIAFDYLGSADTTLMALALVPIAFAAGTQALRTPPGVTEHLHLD